MEATAALSSTSPAATAPATIQKEANAPTEEFSALVEAQSSDRAQDPTAEENPTEPQMTDPGETHQATNESGEARQAAPQDPADLPQEPQPDPGRTYGETILEVAVVEPAPQEPAEAESVEIIEEAARAEQEVIPRAHAGAARDTSDATPGETSEPRSFARPDAPEGAATETSGPVAARGRQEDAEQTSPDSPDPQAPPLRDARTRTKDDNGERFVRFDARAAGEPKTTSQRRVEGDVRTVPDRAAGRPAHNWEVAASRGEPPKVAPQVPATEGGPAGEVYRLPGRPDARNAHDQVPPVFSDPTPAVVQHAAERVAPPDRATTLPGAQLIDAIVQSGKAVTRPDGSSEIRIRLHPPELGAVVLRLNLVNDQLRAEVQVDSHAVRHMVEGAQERIRQALADEGIALERFEVGLRQETASHSGEQQAGRRESSSAGMPAPAAEPADEATIQTATGPRLAADPGVIDFFA